MERATENMTKTITNVSRRMQREDSSNVKSSAPELEGIEQKNIAIKAIAKEIPPNMLIRMASFFLISVC